MHILVFNSGSSSLKFQLFEVGRDIVSLLRGTVTGIGRDGRATWSVGGSGEPEALEVRDPGAAARRVLELIAERCPESAPLAAIAHRVVHGGERFAEPVHVTEEVRSALQSLSTIAPLHNPAALAVIDACRAQLPAVRNIAVFDTAFFRELPDRARLYALPQEVVKAHGLRRYGFHGIAHRYLYERFCELRGGRAESRVITLQLGQGCSISAIRDGRPLDTSMGYTPLEGLMMGTRAGDLDPGILLYMAARDGPKLDLQEVLNRRSGLLGVSGASGDMRELLLLEQEGHAGARLAIDMFCYRARKYLGAYLAVLGGADGVVFGGGIGESAPSIRARICSDMQWCGIALDDAANLAAVGTDSCISVAGTRPEIFALRVDEERLIALEVQRYLRSTLG